MFFNKKKAKQQRIVRFSDADIIVLEKEGMHFELIPGEQVVKYRNVISPRDGGKAFPGGYFDEQKAFLPQDTMDMISAAFDRLVSDRTPEVKSEPLPPGAVHDAYMRISFSGNSAYYTNTHITKRGFVETVPAAEDFMQIVQLLKQHCSFPVFVPRIILEKPSPEVLNRINASIESDRINRFIGYYFQATGVFGCVFYTISDKICSVSKIVSPSDNAMIHGNGMSWRSDFENCTIYPGLTRSIVDGSDGKQLFQIVYKGTGKYEINESILVYCDTENYTVYCDEKVIAKIKRISGRSDCFPIPSDTYYDYEPYFEITAVDGMIKELLMVILAFPMLEFGL